MGTSPIVAKLADMREWAADPLSLVYPWQHKRGQIVIFPEDVLGKTDEQLLEFIRRRCDE